jgi:hypothetical protein
MIHGGAWQVEGPQCHRVREDATRPDPEGERTDPAMEALDPVVEATDRPQERSASEGEEEQGREAAFTWGYSCRSPRRPAVPEPPCGACSRAGRRWPPCLDPPASAASMPGARGARSPETSRRGRTHLALAGSDGPALATAVVLRPSGEGARETERERREGEWGLGRERGVEQKEI